MTIRTYPRATEPHRASLAALLNPLIGGHIQRHDKGAISIEAEFGGVSDEQIQAAVDAAPVASQALDIKAAIDDLPPLLKAILVGLVDLINVERQQHGRGQLTWPQIVGQLKTRVDTLPDISARTSDD